MLMLLVTPILIHLHRIRDRLDDVIALRVQYVLLARGPLRRVRH